MCLAPSFFRSCPMAALQRAGTRDNFYFGTDTDRIISCGIYLEDSDVENGCLRVVPGSHRMGEIVEHRRNPSRHGSWTQIDESRAVGSGYSRWYGLFCFPPICCTALMITTAIARAIVRHGIICPKNSIQKSFQRAYTKIDMWRVSIEALRSGGLDSTAMGPGRENFFGTACRSCNARLCRLISSPA